MNHRELVMPELVKFMQRYDLEKGKNKKVLEIGCGNDKDFQNYFLSLGYDYYSIDNNPKFENEKCKIASMENISFGNNSFDLVFSCHSFEHTEMPVKALQEMKRVTKQYIVIITPHHCIHQVCNADFDHISISTEYQMERWFRYVGITKIFIYTQKENIKLEQNFNLISVGCK